MPVLRDRELALAARAQEREVCRPAPARVAAVEEVRRVREPARVFRAREVGQPLAGVAVR